MYHYQKNPLHLRENQEPRRNPFLSAPPDPFGSRAGQVTPRSQEQFPRSGEVRPEPQPPEQLPALQHLPPEESRPLSNQSTRTLTLSPLSEEMWVKEEQYLEARQL
jgi:hypothetical protein